MPTARAMPISLLRSAASMEKMRKISSKPTPIENRPKGCEEGDEDSAGFIGLIYDIALELAAIPSRCRRRRELS